jgi:hypothetical protein
MLVINYDNYKVIIIINSHSCKTQLILYLITFCSVLVYIYSVLHINVPRTSTGVTLG